MSQWISTDLLIYRFTDLLIYRFTDLLSTGQTQKELEALFPDKRKEIHPIFGISGGGKGKIGKLNPLTGEPGAKQPHANHE